MPRSSPPTSPRGLQVLEAKGGGPLEVLVKTRRGDHWARIWAFADPRSPEKLGAYGAVPMRDPAVERSDVWPSRRRAEPRRRLRSLRGRSARDWTSPTELDLSAVEGQRGRRWILDRRRMPEATGTATDSWWRNSAAGRFAGTGAEVRARGSAPIWAGSRTGATSPCPRQLRSAGCLRDLP
jgi:hypothetical protein